jgi:hypothetical protein
MRASPAKYAITSDLIVLASTQGWARTLSRFYRLGDPGDPDQPRPGFDA